MLDLIGWQGLSPYEQVCVVAGIAVMGWAMTGVYALFGGLTLRRAKPKPKKKAKRKPAKGRR